jgi:hypothetical protein
LPGIHPRSDHRVCTCQGLQKKDPNLSLLSQFFA